MSLSCSCNDDAEWYYEPDDDYSILNTKQRRKCCSCHGCIKRGDIVLSMRCWKYPEYGSIKEKIYGEDGEVPMPMKYLCERCADLYLSLNELGFCINLGDDMRELVKQYAEVYGKRKAA